MRAAWDTRSAIFAAREGGARRAGGALFALLIIWSSLLVSLACVPRAWAVDAPPGVPAHVSGACHIGETWMIGEQSFFTIPSFSGALEGAVPSSDMQCLDHTAAAPEHVDADYEGELVDFSYEGGWVEYYVTITPPDVTDGVTSNELGLIGYQHVGGTVRLAWDFCGGIELVKRSGNPSVTDGNPLYSLQGAVYGIFESRDAAASHDRGLAQRTMTTDAQGTWKTAQDLPAKTYYVAEVSPSSGYALDSGVYTVVVQPGQTARVNSGQGYVTEAPKTNPVTIVATKRDSRTPDGSAQGDASLAGAQFTVCYYPGYHNASSLPASPARSWVFQTDETGTAVADDAHKVAGDTLYRTQNGLVTFPLGTVTVTETAAPAGYRLGEGGAAPTPRVIQISSSSAVEVVSAFSPGAFTDDVQRGGVIVGKVDRQNGSPLPQGSADLAGATIAIVNASAQPVIVDGCLYRTGETVLTMETEQAGGAYVAATGADRLPVGSYTAIETASSEGYVFDEASRAWSCDFQVTSDGEVVDLSAAGTSVANRVVRGDFSFSKVDGQTMERIAGAAFRVTSMTTGESHVIVTDENGMASTSAEWNPHTRDTNANDVALTDSDENGENKADDADAAHENGAVGTQSTPSDAGASESAGEQSAASDVSGTTETPSADANTAGATETPSADAGATGSGADTETAAPGAIPAGESGVQAQSDGEAATPAGAGNTASQPNASAGSGADGQAADGGANVASSEQGEAMSATELDPNAGVWFSGRTDAPCDPDDAYGALPFDTYVVEELPGDANKGLELVRFTVIVSRDSREIDLGTIDDNAGPIVNTSLADANGVKLAPAAELAQVTDRVSYANLDMREHYTMAGSLHRVNDDGTDGGVIATAEAPFEPTGPAGYVDVSFSVDTSDLHGARLVAFEEVRDSQGRVIATHEDLTYEGQTVRVPLIGTTLTDEADGDHAVDPATEVTLVDDVAYSGLTPGDAYTLIGTLHVRGEDGADGGVATDAAGNPLTARANFVAESSEGTAQVTFTFDATQLAGKDVVAFEELERRGQVYAVHADIADEGQTVNISPAPEPERTPAPEPEKDEGDVKAAPSASKPGTAPKTGDTLPLMLAALVPAAVIGFALAFFAVRRMRRDSEIHIARGPER